ncbi:hypothetical protein EDB85DRAFT_1903142 [Lactarius pseudohatsudake]|nr:hypothetical protein EDB85DRAFT_1903142 [Lactarius pseudohatsudake]
MRCGRGERGRTETVQPRCATRREAGSAWPHAPLPARTGRHRSGRLALARGVKREGKGAGATQRAGRCRAPPFRANGVARRGKGKRAGATRRGGAVCPRAPPFRVNEEGEAEGSRALACPLSACPLSACSCPRTPSLRANGVAQTRGTGRGGADVERWGGLASHAPCRCERGCADKREGPGPTRGGGVECSRTPPFRAKGREGPGGRVLPFPLVQARLSRKRRGRGRALVRPLFARMGCRGQGKWRRRHALVRPPSAQTWWRGWGEGRAREVGGRRALCAPYLRAKGGGGGQCGGREGRATYPGGWEERRGREERRRGWAYYHTQFRTNVRIVRESRGGEGKQGKAGGRVVLDPVAEAKRVCHVSTSADVAAFHWRATPPFPPSYRVPPDSYRIGCAKSVVPPIPPSSSPSRTVRHPFSRRKGERTRACRPLLIPQSAPPRSRRKGAHEGTPFPHVSPSLSFAPCPSSSYLAAPVRAGKGARDPPALPFPSRGRGAYGSTPPHHPASAPALPSCPRNPVRTDRGRARPDRPTSPRRPPPAPSLLSAPPHSRGVRACEGKNTRKGDTRKGDTRGHATPRPLLPHSRGRGAREGTPPRLSASPPPSSPSLFAPPHSRGRGAHDTAPLSASPPPLSLPSSRRVRGQAAPTCGAPFAREGVHEAKPTPPPSVSRSGAGRSQCARVHRARTAFSRAIPN